MSAPGRIDINCDMGESLDFARDAELMPYITSCNVACGAHAGEPAVIEQTIRHAIQLGVSVGAHPSYPDREGFGRRSMQIEADKLSALVKEQILKLKEITEQLGGRLAHIKPHGALYHGAADSEEQARCIVEAMAQVDSNLILVGLAGSATECVANQWGQPFASEAFADRTYTPEGRLMPRSAPNAVIEDPARAASQVLSIVREQKVNAGGVEVPMVAATICCHGDNPAAAEILQAIDRALVEHGIEKRCLSNLPR